jgi:hypothetical protein
MSQILHGCKSAYCDTPTCFSSNKHNASRPYRPPTHLTASALAHYLASQDNPNRGLCPHELHMAPSALETANNIEERNEAYVVYPSTWRLAQQHRNTRDAGGTGHAVSEGHEPAGESIMDVVKQRQQARKDPKSLGQNLYDSFTMIYSYSKQIPRPASVLSALVANDPITHYDGSLSGHTTETGSGEDAHNGTADVEHLPHTNEEPTAPHVNGKIRSVREHSHSKVKHDDDDAHPNRTAAKVLRNEQLVHKIPYRPPPSTTQAMPSSYFDPTMLDGASDSSMLSIAKTGKKNFTVGGPSLPTTERTKPLPTARRPAEKNAIIDDWTARGVSVIPSLTCTILDELKEEVYRFGKARSADFNYIVDYDSHRRARRTKPIVNRSLFYTLSNPETLLASFHDANGVFKDSPLPHLDSVRLVNSFRDWNQRNGALIFDSLWLALDALFVPPPELDNQKSPRLRPSRKGAFTDSSSGPSSGSSNEAISASRYLSTHEAAHIVMICIHALTSSVPVGWPHTWAQIRKLRSWGVIVPNAAPNTDAFTHPYMDIIDALEYEPALRLADRLLRAIGTRTCFEHIRESTDANCDLGNYGHFLPYDRLVDVIREHLIVMERVALATKRRMNWNQKSDEDPGWTVTATLMEWLRTIIIKKWDSKWSSVGTAVMVLDKLRKSLKTFYYSI